MGTVNRGWRFAAYPDGMYKPSDFTWSEQTLAPLRDGELRIRNLLLSLDPTNRAWGVPKDTYLPQLRIGDVMRGIALGIVIESRAAAFPVGTYVNGLLGWQEYCTARAGVDPVTAFERDPGLPLSAYFGLYGHIGYTAYFGLLEVGRPRAGETLVVSAAAGATGSLVGQIGRIKGCRVIGIAGGAEKCAWLREQLGFDGVIDYKHESVPQGLDALCPDGIDVYYENVGGAILEAVLDRVNDRARIAMAGQIAVYNDPGQAGPRNLINIVLHRVRMEGFVVFDFLDDAAAVATATRELGEWYQASRLKYRTHVVEGLEQASTAVNMLFTGENHGKLMVRIAEDPLGVD